MIRRLDAMPFQLIIEGQLRRPDHQHLFRAGEIDASMETGEEDFQFRVDHCPVGQILHKTVDITVFSSAPFFVPTGGLICRQGEPERQLVQSRCIVRFKPAPEEGAQ